MRRVLTRVTGDKRLSESNKRPRKSAGHQAKGKRTKQPSEPQQAAASNGGQGGTRAGDVGRALRSVYDETLREDVPCEFKDLLGRLS